jgi:hypothetical protein
MVIALHFDNLWCDVVGCAAEAAFFLAFEFEFGGEAEVAELGRGVLQEDVAEFEVAVQDVTGVQVGDCREQGAQVVLGLADG